MTIIIFLIVLLVVVVVHEWGHFITAKKTGMRVNEFAFGFPPRLFAIKRGETEYSFNAIPLGGYVAIDGENGKTEEEIKNDTKLFTARPRWAQALVLFAGPLMNIILAFVLLSLSFMIGYGNNKNQNNLVVLSVMPGSPAASALLKDGDIINSVYVVGDIDKTISPTADIFKDTINRSAGKDIVLDISRNSNKEKITVSPKLDTESNEYRVGIAMGKLESKKLGFFASIKQGFVETMHLTRDTILGFVKLIGSLFGGESMKGSLTGPIGIAKQVGVAANFGFGYLLYFTALISVNLGILNLFPFPALDGGRLVIVGVEAIRGKRMGAQAFNLINTIGFGILMALMVFVTIKDIIKLF